MADNEDDDQMPLPIVQADGDEVWAKNTKDGDPDPETPFGAALVWWQGLDDPREYRYALEVMSLDPTVWGDYTEAAARIAHLSILTGVQGNADRDDIKYIRFIDYSGSDVGQVFEDVEMLGRFFVVTMVKPEGEAWWRAWGLSDSYFPSTAEITGKA
jgi:hypothetical protein